MSLRNDGGKIERMKKHIDDMVGWLRKNNRAARAARKLPDLFDVSDKRLRDIFSNYWI